MMRKTEMCIINMLYNNCCSRYGLVNRVEDPQMNGARCDTTPFFLPINKKQTHTQEMSSTSFFILLFFPFDFLHFISSCISIFDSYCFFLFCWFPFAGISAVASVHLNWYRCSCTLNHPKTKTQIHRGNECSFKSKINNFN